MKKGKAGAKRSDEPKKSKLITEWDGKPISGGVGAHHVMECGRDIIVIRANEYKGKKSLDLRRFWDNGEEWAPGKGLSVPDTLASEFLEALAQHGARVLQALVS